MTTTISMRKNTVNEEMIFSFCGIPKEDKITPSKMTTNDIIAKEISPDITLTFIFSLPSFLFVTQVLLDYIFLLQYLRSNGQLVQCQVCFLNFACAL